MENSVIFGLSETVEDFLQEGGRAMRGGQIETQGQEGFSFFLHKGALGMHITWGGGELGTPHTVDLHFFLLSCL